MICPHCQTYIVDNAAKCKARRRAKGHCIDCAAPLTEKERLLRSRCSMCALHSAEMNRRWRRRKAKQLRDRAKQPRLGKAA